jgi:hypothetical protein
VDHWTDYLTEEESVELDDIQLSILKHKEKIAALRKRERRFLETGTSRKRRNAA